MSIVLSPTGKKAMVDAIELKETDVIDYVPTVNTEITVPRSGIIEKFWNIGGSVWMKVRDLNGGENEILSLLNWQNYLKSGRIKH